MSKTVAGSLDDDGETFGVDREALDFFFEEEARAVAGWRFMALIHLRELIRSKQKERSELTPDAATLQGFFTHKKRDLTTLDGELQYLLDRLLSQRRIHTRNICKRKRESSNSYDNHYPHDSYYPPAVHQTVEKPGRYIKANFSVQRPSKPGDAFSPSSRSPEQEALCREGSNVQNLGNPDGETFEITKIQQGYQNSRGGRIELTRGDLQRLRRLHHQRSNSISEARLKEPLVHRDLIGLEIRNSIYGTRDSEGDGVRKMIFHPPACDFLHSYRQKRAPREEPICLWGQQSNAGDCAAWVFNLREPEESIDSEGPAPDLCFFDLTLPPIEEEFRARSGLDFILEIEKEKLEERSREKRESERGIIPEMKN
ncbi:hypothetical protein HID58_042454 [Brassica napus]|uniref:ENT domain-containing protein n=1 Tax=Brassica napus TaxID=3708 RepID=A0ABQ8BDS7_BRANA|nr:hypothetical protein HID58_042454 [Brassica napus]